MTTPSATNPGAASSPPTTTGSRPSREAWQMFRSHLYCPRALRALLPSLLRVKRLRLNRGIVGLEVSPDPGDECGRNPSFCSPVLPLLPHAQNEIGTRRERLRRILVATEVCNVRESIAGHVLVNNLADPPGM